MDISAFRVIVSTAAVMLLGATTVSSIAACGKKGPLYLPDAAPVLSAPSGVSAPANHFDQERR